MGMSKGEGGGIIAEERGVGTIVWVRRRNGSWWPGRILGQEELSASHLMSPRSGTPVKLLGREDASVDWYNLEKSKRVKAFRCGEFDACIERAEASQGVLIKKREKYARREDAILHALELEKQMLEREERKFGTGSSKILLATSRNEQDVGFPSGSHAKNNGSSDHVRFVSKSQLIFSKVSSPSETSTVNPLYTQKGEGRKYSTFADDTSETTPRMRELLDYGFLSAQSKRKSAATASSNGIQRPFAVDSPGYGIPGPLQGIEMGSETGLCPKKQRTQGAVDEYLGKTHDSFCPFVQGLQSSSKLPASQSSPQNCVSMLVQMKEEIDQNHNLSKNEICAEDNLPDHSYDCLDHKGYSSDQMQTSPNLFGYPAGAFARENTSSGLNGINESSSTVRDESDDDADTEDDETLFAGIGQSFTPLSRNSERFVEDGTHLDGRIEPLSSDYMYPHYPHEQTTDTSADLGVSKWNLKGKRNIRNITSRPTESMDEMVGETYHGSVNGRPYVSKRHTTKSSRAGPIGGGFSQKYGDLNEKDFFEKYLVHQTSRYGNHRCSPLFNGTSRDHRGNGMYDFDEDSPGMSPSAREGEGVPHVTQQGYWETEGDQFDHFVTGHDGGGMGPMLVDVDLKVQAGYLGEHVPLVSLMSRLNGKSIIGHPVQIKTLDEGSTKSLISRIESGDNLALAKNETPPVWRTAKRTSMQRVPRPHPLAAALEGKEADSLLYSEPTFKKSFALHFDQAKLPNKTSHNHRLVRPVKLQKKALKNVSLSNQKTWKPSSIATEQKTRMGDGMLDGLIKPEGSVPVVSRVPVKVVFSRILEAVGRSSSTAATRRNPIPGPAPKVPS